MLIIARYVGSKVVQQKPVDESVIKSKDKLLKDVCPNSGPLIRTFGMTPHRAANTPIKRQLVQPPDQSPKIAAAYIYLDPGVFTEHILHTRQKPRFDRMVKAIFYVGQGKPSRQTDHIGVGYDVLQNRQPVTTGQQIDVSLIPFWKDGADAMTLSIPELTESEALEMEASILYLFKQNDGQYSDFFTNKRVEKDVLLEKWITSPFFVQGGVNLDYLKRKYAEIGVMNLLRFYNEVLIPAWERSKHMLESHT